MTVEKREYSEFVGKEVHLVGGDSSYTAIVVGCDYHIGITLVDKEDKDHYLVCLHGPLSKRGREVKQAYPEIYDTWDKMFANYLEAIKGGWDEDELDRKDAELLNTTITSCRQPTAATCPFGQ